MAGRLIKKDKMQVDKKEKVLLAASLFSGNGSVVRAKAKSANEGASNQKLSTTASLAPALEKTEVVKENAILDSKSKSEYSFDEIKKELGDKASIVEIRSAFFKKLDSQTLKKQHHLELLKEQIEDLKIEHAKLIDQKEKLGREVLEKAASEAETYLRQAKKNVDETTLKAQKEADEIRQSAKTFAEDIEKKAIESKELLEKNTREQVVKEITEKSWQESKEEITRLKELLQHVLKETIAKRNEIIEASHKHLVDISLTIAKKVVKKIREEDQELVVRTIETALKKVRAVVQLTVRINPEDWEVSQKYYDVFKKSVANLRELELMQDPTLARGDCVIETDLGVIDARLETQLGEIENAIDEVETLRVV